MVRVRVSSSHQVERWLRVRVRVRVRASSSHQVERWLRVRVRVG